MANVQLMLCCRDDYGNRSGVIKALEVYDLEDCETLAHAESAYLLEDEESESPFDAFIHDEHGGSTISIARVEYPLVTRGYGSHVGNMSWDSFTVTEETAKQILTDCLKRGSWSIDSWCEGWGEEDLLEGETAHA